MSTDEVVTPTPAAGQTWHSNAFSANNEEGRIQVLGTVETIQGLIVVYRLVYGVGVGAAHVEWFLANRTYRSGGSPT